MQGEKEMAIEKISSWYGPKQMGIMFYSGFMFAIGSCLLSGLNNTVYPWIAELYDWDVNALRRMSGYAALVPVVGIYLTARICAKFGPKVPNTVALIVTAIALVVFGYTKNYTVFCCVILSFGILGSAYFFAGNTALVANWWPQKKGIVLGFTTIGILLVDLLWTPLIPYAFNAFGLGKTMMAVAIFTLVIGLWGWFFTKNTPEEAGEYPDGDAKHAEDIAQTVKALKEYQSPWTLGKLLKDRGVLGIFAMSLISLGMMTFIVSIVPRLLSCGYEYTLVVKVLIVGGLVGGFGSWFLGLLDQKIGTKTACVIFCTLVLISGVISLFHAQSVVAVWISCTIFFMASGGLMNLIPSAVISRFGRWDYNAAYKVIGSVQGFVSGVGILLTGVFTNYQKMYIFDLVIYIVCLLFVAFLMDLKTVGKED
jgi:sugar phosphate permease